MRGVASIAGPGVVALAGLLLSLVVLSAFSVPREFGERRPAAERDPSRELPEKRLRILTLNSPTTYYERHDGQFEGYEYELSRGFAEHLGLEPEYVVYGTVSELLAALAREKAAVAAAGLSATRLRSRLFLVGPPYQRIEKKVVCDRRKPLPARPEDLAGRSFHIPANSSYEEALARIKRRVPDLEWTADSTSSTEQILERIARGEADCSVADSHIAAINQRYHPELEVAMSVGEPEPLVWLFPRHAQRLRAEAAAWFGELEQSGRREALEYRYYGYLEAFDYYDTRVFTRRLSTRLPRYAPLFRYAARRFDFPWTLLAAISYQESHWEPNAISFTGVRGLMMLTQATAEQVGVADRLDPRQSILGGARYLRWLYDGFPDRLDPRNRLWLTLAAYNVGPGHLADAQTLARRLGQDPWNWAALKTVLPLLSQPRFHRTLKHGYARGNEPVRFVQRVRNYRDLIEQQYRRNPAE